MNNAGEIKTSERMLIEAITFEDGKRIAYLRFEDKNEHYVGSIDGRDHKRLKKLKELVDLMLKHNPIGDT